MSRNINVNKKQENLKLAHSRIKAESEHKLKSKYL